jgi:D-alanyl-D-alanine dipeptidase
MLRNCWPRWLLADRQPNVGLLRIFSQIQKIWIVATIALAALAAFAGPGYAQKRESVATENKPEDIVDLKSAAPSIVVDIRYAGPHNFVGRPIPGYDVDKCLVTRRAAEAVATVQQKLTAFGLSLLVYDCYRPQRGVDYFVNWAAGSSDTP